MSAPAYRVETAFPGGNAAQVSVGAGEVAFTPGPHGGPECLWFHLRVVRAAAAPGAPLRLVLDHPDNMLGGEPVESLRPVLRREEGDWERLPAGVREALPDGRVRLGWAIPGPATWLELACCYPYGREELAALLRETRGALAEAVLGVSQEERPIVRLGNGPGAPGSARPGVYLIARQHSGETPGSWVLDGFLRHVASLGTAAPLVWAVPFANIDGVEQGDYGKDNFPYDLNRAWGDPPMRHETHVIMKDVWRWKERCAPRLALDLHAPGACEAEGIYAFLPNPANLPVEHAQAEPWATAIGAALGPEFTAPRVHQVAYYASRWNTPNFTAWVASALQVPALTLETPYALAGDRVFTRERYREAGVRIATAVLGRLAAGTA